LGTGDGHWWRHGVIYQIYPRSFADANGDGVGDLAGITSRLDHLNDGTPRSLGVDAIWLSPFYPSPMADFGYDVADYTDVDPVFGTLDDLDRLVAEAHARGIRVVVDLVPNHTSDRHPWFLASRSSRDDPKRDWYVWADSRPDGGPPNNWMSSFPRAGRAWTFDEATGQWFLHSFMPEQPDLNWWNPEVREAMDEVMRFWLDRGVDGFRIDVVHRMGHDPELRDNVIEALDEIKDADSRTRAKRLAAMKFAKRFDQDSPLVHEILQGFRRTLDAYDNRMAVGEVYLLDLKRLVSYYGSGDELHLVHNFVFLHQPWKADAFRTVVDEFDELLPKDAWPAHFLGNHDHSRVATRLDEAGDGLARARIAAMMLLTLRGTPFLYQGEELGLRDGEIPADKMVDIDGRDPERTPIPWDGSQGAGFTTGTPWLPIAAGADRHNVAAQRDDPESLLSLYRRLIWYRRGSVALRTGDYRSLSSAPSGLYAYLREGGSERLLIVLNFTAEAVTWDTGPELPQAGRLELTTAPDRAAGQVSLRPIEVGPDEGLLIRLG
jgi:alpha-glucosidase